MNNTLNHTSLQPLLFDFRDFSFSNKIPLSAKEAEFASCWNSIAGMLPSSLFETNRIGRRGYRDADILAVRVAMLFFRQNNIRQTLSFLETSMGVRMTVGMKDVPSESVVSRRSKVLASTLDVFSQLVDEYRFANVGKAMREKPHELIFSRFCASIATLYCESKEVRFYAEQQHLSPKYFATVIKNETGIRAADWIANYVIIQAKEMLRHHRAMSIQQISDALGFSDQSTFSRYFKSHVQITPSEYRIQT